MSLRMISNSKRDPILDHQTEKSVTKIYTNQSYILKTLLIEEVVTKLFVLVTFHRLNFRKRKIIFEDKTLSQKNRYRVKIMISLLSPSYLHFSYVC